MIRNRTKTPSRPAAVALAAGVLATAQAAFASGPCDVVVFAEGFESATTDPRFETFFAGQNFQGDGGILWLVENNSIDIGTNDAEPSNFRVYEGRYAVDLSGFSFGTISIEIPVEAGRRYELAFRYARNGIAPAASVAYSVIGGGEALASGSVTHDIGFSEYLLETARFVANADSVTLRFENTEGRGPAGIALDAVSVTRLAEPCRVDLDGDCEPTLFDFLAFQNLFSAGDPIADFDGDGALTIFDFLAFQNAFAAGCP